VETRQQVQKQHLPVNAEKCEPVGEKWESGAGDGELAAGAAGKNEADEWHEAKSPPERDEREDAGGQKRHPDEDALLN
jgi:hypothetical protein